MKIVQQGRFISVALPMCSPGGIKNPSYQKYRLELITECLFHYTEESVSIATPGMLFNCLRT